MLEYSSIYHIHPMRLSLHLVGQCLASEIFRNAADTWTSICRPMARFTRGDPNKQPTNVLLSRSASGQSHCQGRNIQLGLQPQFVHLIQGPPHGVKVNHNVGAQEVALAALHVRSHLAVASHGSANPFFPSPRFWLHLLSPATLARAMHQKSTVPLILSFHLLLHLMTPQRFPCTLCSMIVVLHVMRMNHAEEQLAQFSETSLCHTFAKCKAISLQEALRTAKVGVEHCLQCSCTSMIACVSHCHSIVANIVFECNSLAQTCYCTARHPTNGCRQGRHSTCMALVCLQVCIDAPLKLHTWCAKALCACTHTQMVSLLQTPIHTQPLLVKHQ